MDSRYGQEPSTWGQSLWVLGTVPVDALGTVPVDAHARNAGKKTIRLPRKTMVVDVFNQKVVARDVDSFTFDAPLHSSWLFCFADDAESLLAGY